MHSHQKVICSDTKTKNIALQEKTPQSGPTFKKLNRQFNTKDCLKKTYSYTHTVQSYAYVLSANSLCFVQGVATDTDNDQGFAS